MTEHNNLPRLSGQIDQQKQVTKLGTRLGGPVLLPPGLEHPCDKNGRPMLLVAQINFAELPAAVINKPDSGLFFLFWNSLRDYSNPKDRHAFRCLFIANPDAIEFANSTSSESSINSPGFALSFAANTSETAQVQFFADHGNSFEIQREIAAFAGNGISWSQARRTDPCFSHLVEASKDWLLLCAIQSIPDAGLDLGSRSMYLLLRSADLQQHNYDKAWLVVN